MIVNRPSTIINVLIVEDSPVVQEFLLDILNADPGIRVIAVAGDGMEAVKSAAENKPDVITMDINMPKMNGIEATRRIMETNPVPIVIVSGNWNPVEVETTFKAMEAGAIAMVQRPKGVGHPDHDKTAGELLTTVKLMSEVKVIRRWPGAGKKSASDAVVNKAVPQKKAHEIGMVAIGTSTGGPLALKTLLAGLPKKFPIPILIVQHIAKGFLGGMVDWLAATSAVPVHVAAHGQEILAGHAYFAPDGFNMGVEENGKIALTNFGSEKIPFPSASFLFRSIAETYGAHAVGILLTGMGWDGANELKILKTKGAITIAQDKESCVVFGMPAVAIELGAATHVLPLDKIAPMLAMLTGSEDHRGEMQRGWKKAGLEVLIIEDSLTQAEKLKFLLEENNYSVSIAHNGREALDLLGRRKPAIILSDIIMPEMDGFEFCMRVKNDEKLRDIPVILLTALSGAVDVLKGLECNADNFIIKPYEDDFLLSKIRYVLANKESDAGVKMEPGLEVTFSGQRFVITSKRRQIVDLLLSTYEIAIKQKLELMTAQDRLKDYNEQLKQKIEERTAMLGDAKRAEEALRQSEERFRMAIRHSPVCVSNQDLNLRYIWQFNPQIAYSVSDVIGKTDMEVLPPETARHLMELKQKALATGGQVRAEISITNNGATRFYNFAAEPLRDMEGAVVGVANVIIDITEQVENRRKIEDLNRFLEHRAGELAFANRELEAFSYSVSHDLRNPLHAINAFCEVLSKDLQSSGNPVVLESLAYIKKETQRMSQVISDLLALSRIVRQEVRHESLDLSAIVLGIVEELKKSEPQRDVKADIEPGLIAYGDPGLVRILLDNLLRNAWKYTSKKKHARIEFGAQNQGVGITYFVKDDGVGFDMAFVDRLFKPYQRLHSEREFEGTGIGLAIVKRIVDKHGGTVRAVGEKDKGAVVYFRLP